MVEGIILAAGLSTRMGVPKVFVEIEGEPLVCRVAKAALDSKLRTIILVIDSSRSPTVAFPATRETARLTVVVNPHPEAGMSSSLQRGLAAADPASSGAMILLGDQPLVTAEVIDHLLAVFASQDQRIVVPTIDGRRTTPVICPSLLFPELMDITGDIGGREVIRRHEDMLVSVEMGSQYDDHDVDTPEDLEIFRSRMRGRADLKE
jgi:molybdenum cofactor cytidylyltransferase